MKHTELDELVAAGMYALGHDEPLKALALFEAAARIKETPLVRSNLAYCMARERGQIKAGLLTCTELLDADPDNFSHPLNLGRILLLNDNRRAAIEAFRAALKLEPHPQVVAELDKLGLRKTRTFNFLTRQNPFNKYLGLLRNQLFGQKLDSNNEHTDNR